MATCLPNREEGIHGRRPWNNPNVSAVSTDVHVTIRHTAVKSMSVAIRMMSPGTGNVLGANTENHDHRMSTHTLTVNADSPLLLRGRVPLDVATSHETRGEEPLTTPQLTWILRTSQIHQQHHCRQVRAVVFHHSLAKQHLPPQTRQVVFHHRPVVGQTHNHVCAAPMRSKRQGHLVLRTGCPLTWVTP